MAANTGEGEQQENGGSPSLNLFEEKEDSPDTFMRGERLFEETPLRGDVDDRNLRQVSYALSCVVSLAHCSNSLLHSHNRNYSDHDGRWGWRESEGGAALPPATTARPSAIHRTTTVCMARRRRFWGISSDFCAAASRYLPAVPVVFDCTSTAYGGLAATATAL